MIRLVEFRDIKFYILRDDLLGEFNGNKARKLEYFLDLDLKTDIVSHGSSQSNAMYSLSVFAKIKGVKFHYFVSHLNENLRQNPIGNFGFALQNGMILHIDSERESAAKAYAKTNNMLFINEGVAMVQAQHGFKAQAKVISEYAKLHSKIFDIFLPSGTGTSAAYLSKYSEFDVYTCPCVGDSEYLRMQIHALEPNSDVKVLQPPKKYHFGDLKPELVKIWQELRDETGIEFELIYDPVGFITLLANFKNFKNDILYIHQGGVLGNISQLQRYKYKGMI
ncbi:hypothetical protein LMG7974_01552 [Campylobacter majalis]|uniref:1-aminocyclopropane-1-carboxylate deaminase n=1 Tax=Campylobacter majalis TaxID=2790656 RepID=A0ABM8Q996_9BACT|nr:1-aminocyclopropane-1-carboxylate deaminase [Campylobacter majalis]CAD7289480.1 hypothetical protein LMG7974_01552 [Campylobacter majalis]